MTTRQRVAVVTGASSGIGKATAQALLAKGWRVIGLGRDAERCAVAESELRATAQGAKVSMLRADLSLLQEAARVADEVITLTDRIDVLINNAGGVRASMAVTSEGNEATFASNHLGAFVLTQRLLPLLAQTAAAQGPGQVRILAVSSSGHYQCPGIDWEDLQCQRRFTTGGAYTNAKLANVLFTRALARRVAELGIVAHAMEPGVVLESNFIEHAEPSMRQYMLTLTDRAVSAAEAAETLVWLATAPEAGESTGGYYAQCKPQAPSAAAQDASAAERLWVESERIAQRFLGSSTA